MDGLALWRALTRPHASVSRVTDQRRARLAAALLLILIPVAGAFVAVYALPDLPGADLADLASLIVLVLFIPAYVLVRGRAHRWGIVLLIAAPIAALMATATPDAEGAEVAYFSVVPVMLGALLLDFRPAAALATLNLAGIGAGLVQSAAYRDPFLFVLAASAVALLGAGFLERSVREAEDAKARLERADAYRLQVLNTVAHDLATPLTPLRLQLRLLEKDGHSERAGVLRRNVELMGRLVSDISDLAKIESARLSIQPQPTDVAALAQQARDALDGRARERGLSIELEALPVMANVDPDRITQVLYNLLSNACKFTPRGGSVMVRVSDGPEARVLVTDTGRGLEPDEMARLFQPFSQVHDRAEVDERGSGLGLYISKGIVEAHGGRVWVESKGRGHGSTFGFALPAYRGQ